ncbi:type II toxin-antitoxin system VapC family toxin [Rhizobium sp. TH2]|uniref:type II toxin-antitoxin system VapC family toxin n=1 Tax=Rhizobium sp. TH2 TaxID=2775403 RepID=UPI0021571C6A|nr:type II toxin-antitoxin system VapC family toxin [Rhizobium sp. TH2]UVC10219.1 type II toxin-antitoxin system VapC family toxin [Rhizobium sp. TH2]
MTFIDTSVIVAILSLEEDADYWSESILDSEGPVTSPLVVLEAAMRLSSKLSLDPERIKRSVESFLKQLRIEVSPIDANDGWTAIQAFQRYGKGRGHPAQLNLADCLSYACAKNRGITLLYKGNDFAATDLA